MTQSAVVSEKGQVTIPKPLRDRLGIRPGQLLDFSEENGRLVARKSAGDSAAEVFGILTLNRSTNEVMDDLRGAIDG